MYLLSLSSFFLVNLFILLNMSFGEAFNYNLLMYLGYSSYFINGGNIPEINLVPAIVEFNYNV